MMLVNTYLPLDLGVCMLVAMDGKTRVYSVRLPLDLNDRLQKIKSEQAHKKVPNSEFLLEAVRLYVEHAERYGIDGDLVVKEPESSYVAKPLKKGFIHLTPTALT